MANLAMTPMFSINVNLEELRLVLKALGGRLKDDEKVLAGKLCDDLTKMRAMELEHTAKQLREAITKEW